MPVAMAACTYLGHIVGSGTVKPQPSIGACTFGTPKSSSCVFGFDARVITGDLCITTPP